jgi:OOP family OmpA-OmpF porin
MGAENYNQGLSEQRASTIADMLIKKFEISQDRVSFVGFGESQPVKNNNTAEGRQHNRRVVAVVEGKKQALEMK